MDTLLLELRDTARAIVAAAVEFADDVEVTIWRSDSTAFEVRGRQLDPNLSAGRLQTGIRVLKGGAMAMAATTTLDVAANVAAARAALGGLRPSALEGFGAGDAPEAPWTWADRLHEIGRDPREVRALAAQLRDRAFAAPGADKRIESLDGAVIYEERRIAHASRGGSGAWRANGFWAAAEINSLHGEHLWIGQGDVDRAALTSLGARALTELPERAVEPAELGGRGEMPAIVHPTLLEGILRYATQEKFSGQAARAGLSRLERGDALFGDAVHLWDAPSEPGLSSSAPFDDERTPTRRLPLAIGGRFQSFLYTRETARKAGAEPTGSGWRFPVMSEDTAEAPVRERFGALVMEPGRRTLAELVAGMERGVLLFSLLGLHGADRARASFSTAVNDGFAVKDGRVVGHLAPGAWNVSGRALPNEEGAGIFAAAELSRERIATGRALLPYVHCKVHVG